MLKSAAISHFKSVSEAKLKFGKENVIVGPNGVGKSNIVDALYFIRDAAREDLDFAVTKRHGIESIRQWSRTRPFNISIELGFKAKDSSGSYRVVISSARGNFKVEEESAEWTGPISFLDNSGQSYTSSFKRSGDKIYLFSDFDKLQIPKELPISHNDLFLTQIGSKGSSIASIFFNSLSHEITSFAAYAIYPNTIRTPQSVSNEEMLSDTGSNLASIIKRMTTNTRRKSRESLVDSLKAVLP